MGRLDDPFAGRRSGMTRDRLYRHWPCRVRKSCIGTPSAATCLASGSSRQSGEGDRQTDEAGAALFIWPSPADGVVTISSATRLSVVRHRLETSAGDVAADISRVKLFVLPVRRSARAVPREP